MKSEFLAHSPLLVLPLIALFFFLTVFVVVVIDQFRRRPSEGLTRLPLDDGEKGRES